jgi:hypothetical protein
MTRYSITRKRNNKKYKKSPKGRGKGRRSIRRCKTRKPKGFKKAKRYTVGKRRQMVGGVIGDDYNFFINTNMLTKYIKKEYSRSFGATSLVLDLKGFGYAFITKLTRFSDENRYEKIAVYSCSVDGTINFYAIVRCNEPGCPVRGQRFTYQGQETPGYTGSNTPNHNMETKILFVTKGGVTKGAKPFTGNNITDAYKITECYEFKNSISTTDNYRIFVDTRYDNKLQPIFEALSKNTLDPAGVTFDAEKARDVARNAKSDAEKDAYAAQLIANGQKPDGMGLGNIIAESL